MILRRDIPNEHELDLPRAADDASRVSAVAAHGQHPEDRKAERHVAVVVVADFVAELAAGEEEGARGTPVADGCDGAVGEDVADGVAAPEELEDDVAEFDGEGEEGGFGGLGRGGGWLA